MKVVAAREVSGDELREWRQKRERRVAVGRSEKGASGDLRTPDHLRPPEPTDPVEENRPAKPAWAHQHMVDMIWRQMRRSKESWATHVALLRRANPHLVGHLTDGQIAEMLKARLEDEVRKVYHQQKRDRELVIRTGGF